MPSGSSGEGSCGRATQTEARSTGREIAANPTGRKSLSRNLDALDRATRSAHAVTASSSVGTDADASATHAAIPGFGCRSTTRATLWSQAGQHALQALSLAPFASQRRAALLGLYPVLQKAIEDLDQQVSEQALRYPQAQRLMTHPGVGPVTALATQVFLGDPQRFADGRAVASYIGLIPSERSSGRRQRLGKLSKEGNALVRYLWGEATIHAVRRDPELKRFYRRKLMQKGLGKAKTAAARKLGIRLWIMLRDQIDYKEFCRRGLQRQKSDARAGMPGR
jgi:transposase